jgi:hypothetical protein
LADKTIGDAPFAVSATASSGLTVSFSTTSDKITIAGTQVTLVKAGRASIKASQAGNANYNAAEDVTQSFCIKPAKPTISVAGANTEVLTLTSSAAAGNQWFRDGAAIGGQTNASLSVSGEGVYTVQVTVDDCASAVSDPLPVIVTGDARWISPSAELMIYPNPVREKVTLRWPAGDGPARVALYQMDGRQVMQQETEENEITLELGSQPGSAYLVRVSAGKKNYQGRIIRK